MNVHINWTPRCGRAIEAARKLASADGHLELRTDHLVFGLLTLGGGVSFQVMAANGLSPEKVREFAVRPGLDVGEGVENAMARADEEARLLEHTYTGTEHLLISLLAERIGAASKLFDFFRVDRRKMTVAVLEELEIEIPADANKILILEDNSERVAQFREMIRELFPGWGLDVWASASPMISQLEENLPGARLISLDHDLEANDPGCGRDVSRFLAGHFPSTPVIIHSSNTDAAWSMHNDLRFAGWTAERVGPIGDDWVRKLWAPKAREMTAQHPAYYFARRKMDHAARVEAAMDSLEGLAIGDALGEMLAYGHRNAEGILAEQLPPSPWRRTDDSEMAISILEILRMYGYVHSEALARRFAWRFECDPERGYGKMTRIQLAEVNRGGDWRSLAQGAFSGNGSMGNGAAMRVAPLGAFFWSNTDRVIIEATRSAVITHTHTEGIAGAIAVAVAAGAAARKIREGGNGWNGEQILEAAFEESPASAVRDGLGRARQMPGDAGLEEAVKVLGNGSGVTAPDTVPFAIWCAANNGGDFAKSVARVIKAGGDCDTNAAIVGGIVAAFSGREGIPSAWRERRERWPWEA